jgi:hypothetical protein
MPGPGVLRKAKESKRLVSRRKRNSPASDSTPNGVTAGPTLSREEIAARAYALFLARGGQHGDDWTDWFLAEAALQRERDSEKSSSAK